MEIRKIKKNKIILLQKTNTVSEIENTLNRISDKLDFAEEKVSESEESKLSPCPEKKETQKEKSFFSEYSISDLWLTSTGVP